MTYRKIGGVLLRMEAKDTRLVMSTDQATRKVSIAIKIFVSITIPIVDCWLLNGVRHSRSFIETTSVGVVGCAGHDDKRWMQWLVWWWTGQLVFKVYFFEPRRNNQSNAIWPLVLSREKKGIDVMSILIDLYLSWIWLNRVACHFSFAHSWHHPRRRQLA